MHILLLFTAVVALFPSPRSSLQLVLDPGSRAPGMIVARPTDFGAWVVVFLASTGRNRDLMSPEGQNLKWEFLGHLLGMALHSLHIWAVGATASCIIWLSFSIESTWS